MNEFYQNFFNPFQIGLRRLLILFVVVAVWVAYWNNERHRKIVQKDLIRILKSTRSLDVRDTSGILIKQTKRGMEFATSLQGGSALVLDDFTIHDGWQCFLPRQGWELCIATRDIAVNGMVNASKSISLRKGVSEILLMVSKTKDGSEIVVELEGVSAIVLREDEDWCSRAVSLAGSPLRNSQLDGRVPIELCHHRFDNEIDITDTKTSDPASNKHGIVLWIREIENSKLKTPVTSN